MIIIAVIVVLISGFYLVKSMQYYRGSGLEKQVAEMRKHAQEKERKPAEKPKKKIDLEAEFKKFYGNIVLTPEQKTYAEETIQKLNQLTVQYRKDISQLAKRTRQAFSEKFGGLDKIGITESEFNRLTPERIYQTVQKSDNLSQNQKQELTAVYQDYRTKRKELLQPFNQTKQAIIETLINLLTSEQKQIYLQEHPSKK